MKSLISYGNPGPLHVLTWHELGKFSGVSFKNALISEFEDLVSLLQLARARKS